MNWQRDVSIEERAGRKVVVKRNKSTKEFHEFILSYVYTLISLLLLRPSRPVPIGVITNEGQSMRAILEKLNIPTPELLSEGDDFLVEEFVGENLYYALANSGSLSLAFAAGVLTGRLHHASYVFVDNKAQNYLVRNSEVIVRTDLGFIQKTGSLFSRSMDIGSFLASVIDLQEYPQVEKAFYKGYVEAAGRKFSYLAIILRNLLSLGFSSNSKVMFQNVVKDTRPLIES